MAKQEVKTVPLKLVSVSVNSMSPVKVGKVISPPHNITGASPKIEKLEVSRGVLTITYNDESQEVITGATLSCYFEPDLEQMEDSGTVAAYFGNMELKGCKTAVATRAKSMCVPPEPVQDEVSTMTALPPLGDEQQGEARPL